MDDPPGDDEHLSGDASIFGSVLMFLGFWVDFDRWKRVLLIRGAWGKGLL